jgi:hypothetical protein
MPLVAELPKFEDLAEEDLSATKPVGYATGDVSRVLEVGDGRSIDLMRVFLLRQASELEGTLRDAGLPAIIVPVDAPFQDDHPRFEVRVRNADHGRAEEVLRAAFEGAVAHEATGGPIGEVDAEHCPACGAHVPLDVEECPDCGLNVGGA